MRYQRLSLAALLVFLSSFATQLRAQNPPPQPAAAQAPATTPAPAAAPNGTAPAATPAPNSKTPTKPAGTKKVWTDDDMGSLTGPTYEATPNPNSRSVSSRQRSYSSSPNAEGFRTQIDSLKAKITDIDRKLDNFNALAHGETVGSGESRSGVRITDNRADIQDLVKQREALQKQISDVEDRARHAGVEPGQLR